MTKTVNQGFYLYFKKIGGIPAKIVPGVHRHFEGILAKIVPGVHRHFEGIPAKIVPENRRGCVFETGDGFFEKRGCVFENTVNL